MAEDCVDAVDRPALEQWTGDVIYLDRDRARRDFDQAQQDAAWLDKSIAAVASPIPLARDKAVEQVRADPKLRGRVDRFARGQSRLRAVRALQDKYHPLESKRQDAEKKILPQINTDEHK